MKTDTERLDFLQAQLVPIQAMLYVGNQNINEAGDFTKLRPRME